MYYWNDVGILTALPENTVYHEGRNQGTARGMPGDARGAVLASFRSVIIIKGAV